jgi:hypothetical protein
MFHVKHWTLFGHLNAGKRLLFPALTIKLVMVDRAKILQEVFGYGF